MCCRCLSQCARWSNPYFFQFEAFALEIEGELLKLVCWFVLWFYALVDDFPSNPTIEIAWNSIGFQRNHFQKLHGYLGGENLRTKHSICGFDSLKHWTHSSISWVVAIFKDLLKLHTFTHYITLHSTPLHSIPFHCIACHPITSNYITYDITLHY